MQHTHLYRMLVPLLALAFMVPVVVCAASYEEAMSALEEGDYRAAYRDLKRLAQDGNPEAQYQVGMLLLFGQGVRKRVDEGVDWLKQAADNGSYLAANELAQIYASGRDVKPDEQEAMKWIERATQLGKKHPEEADEGCE